MSSISGNQESRDLKDEFEVRRRDAERIRPGRKQRNKQHACKGLRWEGIELFETLKKASVTRGGHSER